MITRDRCRDSLTRLLKSSREVAAYRRLRIDHVAPCGGVQAIISEHASCVSTGHSYSMDDIPRPLSQLMFDPVLIRHPNSTKWSPCEHAVGQIVTQ
ncbi:hypothetical protein NDU88_004336 [Pleurodeles waltl]|uniref:Uncharacterized protein n=1 Tax=Pleurodeles waltl TaxID=8319 RepID=A0AAV7W4Z4_PLEWA|nr:hypothetical protein NDU88_004336 [Pleurodeles waltl]